MKLLAILAMLPLVVLTGWAYKLALKSRGEFVSDIFLVVFWLVTVTVVVVLFNWGLTHL